MVSVGITERGDAALSNEWKPWVEKGLPAILITKNPVKLINENPLLFSKSNRQGNVILHATITGMGGYAVFEENVPHWNQMLSKLQRILDNPDFDRSRIVIHQDPIFVPFLIAMGSGHMDMAMEVPKFAKKNELRYRMSFLDLYPHVKTRMLNACQKLDDQEDKMRAELAKGGALMVNHEHPHAVELYNKIIKLQPEMHLPLNTRLDFLELLKNKTGLTDDEIEICGEPEMKCTGCLSKRDFDTFDIELDKDLDTGFQRPACACLGLKKELLSNKHPCGHKCVYCFWKD